MKPVETSYDKGYRKSRKSIGITVSAVSAAVILILLLGGFNSAGTVNVLWTRAEIVENTGSYISLTQENAHTYRTGSVTAFSFTVKDNLNVPVTFSHITITTAGFRLISSNLPVSVDPGSSHTVTIRVTLPSHDFAGDLNVTLS